MRCGTTSVTLTAVEYVKKIKKSPSNVRFLLQELKADKFFVSLSLLNYFMITDKVSSFFSK